MNALPTVVREMRVSSRQKKTYWMRVGVCGAFILAGCYVIGLVGRMGMSPATLGMALYSVLVQVAFFYSLAAGINNTADCISQEKRDGTLGLLFLTDLTGYDIIMGKLFAKGLVSFYSFLAGVPILGMSILLGGVTGTQFWEAALALLNVFFFSHAAGLMVSTFSLQARKAHAAAVALIIFFAVVAPMMAAFPPANGILGWINWDWLTLFSLAQPLISGFGRVMPSGVWGGYWGPLLATHALAWTFLGVASWHLPDCWQDRPKAPLKQRWRQWLFGALEVRSAFRKQLIDINPFYWLVSRSRFEPAAIWTMLGGVPVIWIWVRFRFPAIPSVLLNVVAVTVLSLICRAGVAAEASRHFEEQRLNGSLEFLLSSSPLTVPEILGGQWLGIKRKWLGPVIVVFILDLLLLAISIVSYKGLDRAQPFVFMGLLTVLLPLDLVCSCWAGMWRGLKSRKIRHAGGQAFAMTFFFPLVLYFTFVIVLNGMLLQNQMGFWAGLFFWVLFSISTQLLVAFNARRVLSTEFRLLASPLSAGTFSVWRWLGRNFGLLIHRGPVVFTSVTRQGEK